ncbi:MAG: DUF401 family protein [Pseudomonadota bacterium]
MLSAISAIPVLFKTLCVFGLILVLNRLRLSLTYALGIGALGIGLWTGLDPLTVLKSAGLSLLSLQTVSMALIVGIILVMSRLMKESGHLDRIVQGFGGLSRDDRMTGAVMATLLGLLPMPGGALFSAPMVERALCRLQVTAEDQTGVNYWFRHSWELWCPLYPGFVLAVALLQVDTWRFMAVMFPVALLTFLVGVIFIIRPLDNPPDLPRDRPSRHGLGAFMWEIMPISLIVLVILAFAGAEGILGRLGVKADLPGTLHVLAGLIASFGWVCAVNRIPPARIRSAILDRQILPMLLLIFAIMIFKGVLADSRAALQIRSELLDYHIPVALVILILPFLSGLITGVALAYVGISFPLIIPLFQGGDLHHTLAFAAVAHTFGFLGMMLSPVHLCFLVTKDYFKAGFLGSYRRILLPTITIMVLTGAAFFIYQSY